MSETAPAPCPYCRLDQEPETGPVGGWIHRDEDWLVSHGPPEASRPGTVKITSRRHYTDFAEMSPTEAASFGVLLTRLDAALQAATDAERVHLVSTRDRVAHFHAWLYPRPAASPLRGTDFLAAPQQCSPDEADTAAHAIRRRLEVIP